MSGCLRQREITVSQKDEKESYLKKGWGQSVVVNDQCGSKTYILFVFLYTGASFI